MGYKINLLTMAFKNLGRHRVKTAVTIVACGIIAPLISILVSIAPINRALNISISNALRFE